MTTAAIRSNKGISQFGNLFFLDFSLYSVETSLFISPRFSTEAKPIGISANMESFSEDKTSFNPEGDSLFFEKYPKTTGPISFKREVAEDFSMLPELAISSETSFILFPKIKCNKREPRSFSLESSCKREERLKTSTIPLLSCIKPITPSIT
ncbi:hypothetical protein D3C80_1406670 [compost metagenome]